MARWAELDGCRPVEHTDVVTSTVHLDWWDGCRSGADVELYRSSIGGHTWPGREPSVPGFGATDMSISANELMWEFFSRHRLR